MLKCYGRNSKGKLVKQSDVYLVKEHGIHFGAIDREARRICSRLVDAGYQAYIVGGAVRDLLLEIVPKDFDIVTDAHPSQVRRICKRARIIGRRFPLVHVVAPSGRIFEVATFRALNPDDESKPFGTMYEDAFRRDFTINSLYYDVKSEKIFDFHDAYNHIKSRQIVLIIPPVKSFKEDPVRMLRVVKYAVTTSSTINKRLERYIRSYAKLLVTCSNSRLTEELNKVLQSEYVFDILQKSFELKLLNFWLPSFTKDLRKMKQNQLQEYWDSLRIKQHTLNNPDLIKILRILFEDYLNRYNAVISEDIYEAYRQLKQIFFPLVFPNIYIEKVVKEIFHDCNYDFCDLPHDVSENSDNKSPKRSFRQRLRRLHKKSSTKKIIIL